MSRFGKQLQTVQQGPSPAPGGNRFGRALTQDQPQRLTQEQERAAEEWYNYTALARKNHGDRVIDLAGQGVAIPQDEEGQWKTALDAAARSGWKAPEKASLGDAIVTGLGDFSFGFADEVGAGTQALGSFLWNLPGKGVEGAAKDAGDTFDLRMDQSNFMYDRAHQQRPVETAAAAIIPSLVPGIGLASRANAARATTAAPAATTAVAKFLNAAKGGGKLAVTGAAMGELAGIGAARGDLLERVKEAGVEAPLWGVGGAVLGSAIGRGLGAVVKRADDAIRPVFMSPENRSLYMLERAMKRDGVTVQDLQTAQRRVKAMGGNTLETLAELAAYSGKSTGKNLRGLARALHAQPGPASELAEKLIEKRRASIHTGASKAVAAGTGKKVDDYADQISDLEEKLRTDSSKAYDDFRVAPVRQDIFEQRIAPLLNTEPGRVAMTSARNNLLVQAASYKGTNPALADDLTKSAQSLWARVKMIEADDLRTAGNTAEADALSKQADALWQESGLPRETLPPRALDEIKKAFDDQIETAGQRSYTGGGLRSLKNNFAEHVSAATDGAYGQALGTFSGGKRLREAIDAGYGAFNKKAWQLDELLDGTGGPGGVLSQGEVDGLAFGFGRALQDAIDSNDMAGIRRLTRDKGMQAKLRALMGPQYPRFMSRIVRMTNLRDFDNFVAGGSPTARIQAELADAQGEDAVTRIFNNLGAQAANGTPSIRGAITAAAIQPAARKISNAWRKLAYRGIGNEAVNTELGERMFTPMTDSAMQDLAGSMSAQPASAAANIGPVLGNAGALYGAQSAGREAVPANSPEERAEFLVEDYDGAMLEEYLDPRTGPDRLRAIEAHFGPQAAELWQMRAAVTGNR